MVAPLNRVHAAAGILGERGAKACGGRRMIDSGSSIAHGDQHGHCSVRPTLHADAIFDHVAAAAQVAQGSVGVKRPHGLLAHRGGATFVTPSRESGGVAAWGEAVDEDREVAAVGPELAPLLVAFGKSLGGIDAVGRRRVGSGPAVEQHDGRVRSSGGGFEKIGDQIGLVILGGEVYGSGSGGARCEEEDEE